MKSDRGASFSALSACFREHAALVNGVVYDRCGDVAIAEEITAQTFEAAAVRFAQGRGDEVTPGWLTVVARRRLIDHWRHMSARRRALERLGGEPCTSDADTPIDDDDRLTAALDLLPARQRTALTLRHVDGWSVDEIAQPSSPTRYRPS